MFKSAEKLRHEAAQRQLDRVASTWRSSRTTWFDGTPESIEARLAQTERVLTVARSGYTPAHLELTVEAENARRELLAAKHRLLTDFLDDGARAFKGSRRVGYGEHSMDDRIDQAYENGGVLDRSLVGVNPGDGIYRNHPGMIDGYDEGDYATSPGDSAFGANSWDNAYDASEDPNFVPADYLGPAGRDLGGKHRLHENDHGMWEDQLMEGGGPGAPQNGPGKHRAEAGLHIAGDYGHGDISEPCPQCGAGAGEGCLDVNHFRAEDDPRQKAVRYLPEEYGARRHSGDPHPHDVYQSDPELFDKIHWG